MPFHDDITAEIAATSCGIPAVAHLMARTLAVHARDRKANFVSRVHFDYVLGNRGHLEEWAEQFLPAHLLGWYQGQTNAVLAVIAYAGRHRTPFSPAQLAVALPEFSAAELSEAFATARQSGVLRSTDDERSYEPLELIATIPAFWELHARSRAHKSGGSDAIAHLSAYDFSPARADTQDDRSLFNWLHLSDIHVGHPDAVHGWDQQLVLSELSRDIEDCTKREYPLPDALILTGDIAFSGQIEQYERARDFLSGLSTRLNINADRIFIVPGNHDVQRAVAQKDKDIERLVKSLRSGTDSLDDALARTRDSKKLAQRQRNYLDFVSNLSSTPGDIRAPRAEKASELFWSRSLQMRNGLMVRMVGINSSLLAQDDDDRGLLRIGMKQLAKGFTSPPPLSNEFVMALSHHPCIGGWLADEADVQSWLRRYAHVHLAGHVHESRSEQSRAGGGQSFIQIVAGAVHGDKLPPGVPASHGYNFGSVVSDGTGALSLRIWPRRWASLKKDFRVDVEHISYPMLYAEHELPIRLDVKEHA